MLSPLKEAGHFARQHLQPLLTIALLLTVPIWLIDYAFPPTLEADSGLQGITTGLLFTCLAVIQFAAGMIYIHQQVLGDPVGPLRAISLGASRLGPLLLINLLMGLAVGLGLMLLILPGLYIAYKLLFGEFYLLFHGQSSWQSLRSSYRANHGLTDKLLPPLLAWGTLVAAAAIGQQLMLQQSGADLIINVVFESAALALTIWGWALLYRLYQRYIAPNAPAQQSMIAPADAVPPAQDTNAAPDELPPAQNANTAPDGLPPAQNANTAPDELPPEQNAKAETAATPAPTAEPDSDTPQQDSPKQD